jgi:uncharacterized protein (DUF488 family)
MKPLVLTIGHSNHGIAAFVDLLTKHDVTAIADVRSSPFSRYNPQFNREALIDSLRDAGIKYVFLGAELGARSEDPSCYVDGRVQYDRLAMTALFQRGIERVVEGCQSFRVAMMCAEKDPLDCHRTILVARSLVDRGIDVSHILSDGRIEPHDDAMQRLMRQLSLPEQDMFKSAQQILDEAYATRGAQIAYDRTPQATGPSQASEGDAP